MYLLINGASGVIESKPSRSAEDQDPISPKLLANHCISEADTLVVSIRTCTTVCPMFLKSYERWKKNQTSLLEYIYKKCIYKDNFLALMELCRRNYCLNAIDMSKVDKNLANEDFVESVINGYGSDISISKQHAFFVKGWPHTYAIAVKKRRSAKSIWELFNGEDAAKNKIDANLIVKASTKFRRLYVKEFISVQVNKKIVTWHDVPTHHVSAENVNTNRRML